MDFASCIYAKDQNDFESLFNKKEQYEITPLIKSILNIYIAYAKKYEHSAKLFSTSFESSVKVEEGNDALQKLGIKPEEIIEARLITGKKQYNNYLIGFMYKEKI